MRRLGMVLMFWTGLLLAGGAQAAGKTVPFTCKLPWHRGATSCHDKMFSIRPGEKVSLAIRSIKDSDGDSVKGCPKFLLIDQNDEDSIKKVDVCIKEPTTIENSGSSEIIVKLESKMEGWGSVTIEGTYTISQGK